MTKLWPPKGARRADENLADPKRWVVTRSHRGHVAGAEKTEVDGEESWIALVNGEQFTSVQHVFPDSEQALERAKKKINRMVNAERKVKPPRQRPPVADDYFEALRAQIAGD